MARTKKTVQTEKYLRIQRDKKRARRYTVHSELYDVKVEIGILQKAIESEGGTEWYLHQQVEKSQELQAQIKELDKELKESDNERI